MHVVVGTGSPIKKANLPTCSVLIWQDLQLDVLAREVQLKEGKQRAVQVCCVRR